MAVNRNRIVMCGAIAATALLAGITAGPAASAATVPAAQTIARSAENPPPGYIYQPGHTYDNDADCEASGALGVFTLQWKAYVCLQNDYGSYDLWILPNDRS